MVQDAADLVDTVGVCKDGVHVQGRAELGTTRFRCFMAAS